MEQAPRFPSLFYRRDLSAFAIPFVGAVFCWQCFPGVYLILAAAIFLTAALCFAFRRDRRRAYMILMAGVACGTIFAGIHQALEPARLARNGREISGRGIVVGQTDTGCVALFLPEGSIFPVSVLTEEEVPLGAKFRGKVTLDAAVTAEDRAAGASYVAEGRLTRVGSDPILRGVGLIREKCLSQWKSGDVGAFYQAALFGDRSGLSGSLKKAFRADGAMHLLAVSGLHVSQILGAVFYSLFFLTRDRRLTRMIMFLLLPAIAVLTGGAIPVLRASIMTGISLLVSLSGRRPDPLTGLSLAALILTIVFPYAVGSISFQLSFLCTLSIIAVAAPMTDRIRAGAPEGKRFLSRIASAAAGSFFISLSAFVFTLPSMAYTFGTVQPFAALYNLLFIPLFVPCVALGLLSLPAAFFPALSFLKVPAEWYGKFFLALIRFVADGALGTSVTLGAAAPFMALLALGVLAACFAFRIRCDHFLWIALFLMAAVFLLGVFF